MNGSSWLDHNFDNYQVVEQSAVAVVQRGILNFTGAVTVTDNPANGSTDVAITGASVPTGTGFWHITSGGSDVAAKLVANADVSTTAAIDVSKLAAGGNGEFLQVVGGVPTWDTAPVTGITDLTGDVTATGPGSAVATVAKIHGASVPVAGALTTGNVLQVSGASALSYGPINLAGGANYVTGTLPTGNQAAQAIGGDGTGTTAALVIVKLTGTAGVVNTPNSNWALTSLQAGVGKIIETSAGVANFGDASGTTTAQLLANTAVYMHGGATWQLSAPTGYVDATTVNFRDTGGSTGTVANFFGPIKLNADSGTFPSIGQVRFKNYASETAVIAYRHAGGDGEVMTLDGANQIIRLGHDAATVGSALRLFGYYGLLLSSSGIGMTVSTPATADSIKWQSTGNIRNMTLTVAGSGGDSLLRFGDLVTATLKHDAATSDVATKTTTIEAQEAYASATGTNQRGGNLALLSGANKSGYTSTIPGVQIGQKGSVFASGGTMRVAKDFSLWARDSTNATDLEILAMNGDDVGFGNVSGGAAWFWCHTSGALESATASVQRIQADNGIGINGPVGGVGVAGVYVGTSTFQWSSTSIDVTAGNVTASAAQAASVIIKVTGTPGGVNTVILPDVQDSFYIVVNATGSGANVRFAKVAGGGVSVAVNKTQLIRHDGSDYVLVTTAA